MTRPTRLGAQHPRLRASLAATGAAVIATVAAQPRGQRELDLGSALLARVGHGTTRTRWWEGDWYAADYTAERAQLLELRQLQTDLNGDFNFHDLMKARVCADSTLLDASGQPVRADFFPGLVRANDTIGDLIEIQRAARSFRRLCDTVVYNYPAVLATHDPLDVIRVSPATIDSWRLRRRDEGGCTLIWEPSAGIQIDLGAVHTVREATARVRKTLDSPDTRAHDHEWLCPVRSIWHGRAPPTSKKSTKHLIRAEKVKRGRLENAARCRKLIAADAVIGTAMAAMAWSTIDKLRATTSRQRLRLRRLKGDRITGWDRLHDQHGCPHCPAARDGGSIPSIPHIFWTCPAAQALWTVFATGWVNNAVWSPVDQEDQLKHAVFGLKLPRFPGALWRLPALAAIDPTDTAAVDTIHTALQTAWQQQVLEVFAVIWKWRHQIEDNKQQWSQDAACSYLHTVLCSSLRGLHERLPRHVTLRDPRRQLLIALARGFDNELSSEPCVAATARTDAVECRVLFFDGGSRGNPGPGGAGAVIVALDAEAHNPRVVWSSCMSYAQTDMTNNKAEYLGLLAGLKEAQARGWKVDVVGDRNLILRQLAHYRPPRNAALRPLYSEARRIADIIQVEVWQHHLRAFNKMADAAANVAMDTCTSVQVAHPSDRPHTAIIEGLLQSDFHEWHTRHLLRQVQEQWRIISAIEIVKRTSIDLT